MEVGQNQRRIFSFLSKHILYAPQWSQCLKTDYYLCHISESQKKLSGSLVNYYGRLTDIVQLNYSGKLRVVLFKCDWVDIDKGCKTDEFGIKLVNFSHLTHKGDNLLDDPFVLASQVDKVFYTHDSKFEDWMVARHVKVKDTFNMQCDIDDNILSSLPHSNDLPNFTSGWG